MRPVLIIDLNVSHRMRSVGPVLADQRDPGYPSDAQKHKSLHFKEKERGIHSLRSVGVQIMRYIIPSL